MKKSFFQMEGFPIVTNLEFNTFSDFNFTLNTSLEIDMAIKVSKNKINDTKANVILEIELFPKKENSPFYLKIISQATFIWDKSISPADSDTLLTTNAPAIILSYIRPIISNITTYSGQPPLVIPLLDFSNSN